MFQGDGGMDTAVIKFNSLADSIWAAAEDHNFWLVRRDRIFVWRVVGRIVISVVFRAADMDAFPRFADTEGNPFVSDVFFWDFQDFT